jgi:hypothetical protein
MFTPIVNRYRMTQTAHNIQAGEAFGSNFTTIDSPPLHGFRSTDPFMMDYQYPTGLADLGTC